MSGPREIPDSQHCWKNQCRFEPPGLEGETRLQALFPLNLSPAHRRQVRMAAGMFRCGAMVLYCSYRIFAALQ